MVVFSFFEPDLVVKNDAHGLRSGRRVIIMKGVDGWMTPCPGSWMVWNDILA